MRLQPCTVFLFVAVCLLIPKHRALALTEFRSEAGRFTVLLPATPKVEEVANKDDNGIDYIQTQYQVTLENGAIVVSFQDNPQLVDAAPAEAAAALEKGRDALKNMANGPVQVDNPVKLQGKYPGRDFAAEIPAMQGVIRARLYLVSGRLIQILVVGTPDLAKSDESTKILESLTILDEKDGK